MKHKVFSMLIKGQLLSVICSMFLFAFAGALAVAVINAVGLVRAGYSLVEVPIELWESKRKVVVFAFVISTCSVAYQQGKYANRWIFPFMINAVVFFAFCIAVAIAHIFINGPVSLVSKRLDPEVADRKDLMLRLLFAVGFVVLTFAIWKVGVYKRVHRSVHCSDSNQNA
jgi:hypothetical protein